MKGSSNNDLQPKQIILHKIFPQHIVPIVERLTFCRSHNMLAWDSVPHREAARTPHDVPTIRGSTEFQIHGIRPLMPASALDLEGLVAKLLDDYPVVRGFGLNTRVHEKMLLKTAVNLLE